MFPSTNNVTNTGIQVSGGSNPLHPPFLMKNLSFLCVKLAKNANDVLAPPLLEESRLAPLLFKVSGYAPVGYACA